MHIWRKSPEEKFAKYVLKAIFFNNVNKFQTWNNTFEILVIKSCKQQNITERELLNSKINGAMCKKNFMKEEYPYLVFRDDVLYNI